MGNMNLHVGVEKQSGGALRNAGQRLLALLTLKKLEPETLAAKGKRKAAMSARDYSEVARCDMLLGMDNTKVWKKAGDRLSKCYGKEGDAASCYLKAGRSDLLIKKMNRAEKERDFEAAATYAIAYGCDPAQAWKAAGDAYFAIRYYGMSSRCYKKGGFETEATKADAMKTRTERPESGADDWQTHEFIMHPHR
jgi:hypothetical protein